MSLLLSSPRCAFTEEKTVHPAQAAVELESITVEVTAQGPAGPVTDVTVVDRGTLAASNKSDLDKVLNGLPGVTLLRNTRGALSAFALRGANAS